MALGLVGAIGEALSTPVRMLIFSHIANDLLENHVSTTRE